MKHPKSEEEIEPVAVRRATAARLLDCSPSTIHSLIKRGDLKIIKVGADQRVTVASIRRLATPAPV